MDDLSSATQSTVIATLSENRAIHLDTLAVSCDTYQIDPSLLSEEIAHG